MRVRFRLSRNSRTLMVCAALMLAMAFAGAARDGGPALAQSASSPAAALQKPDDTRFKAVTLVPPGELDEPMTFSVAKDGRVFINERRTGDIKVYDPVTKKTTRVGTIPINHQYTSASGAPREAEEGFVGLTLDPGFETNRWAYIMFADPDVAKHTIARIEMRDEIGGRRASDAHRAGIVQGASRVPGPARAVLPHRRRDGVGRGRKPVHHRRQQHLQQRRIANGRTARPGAVGRSARRGEHERPARQDPPHSSRAGRHLHDSRRQSLSAGHAGHAARDLHDGPPKSVARLGRQPHRLCLLGRSRTRQRNDNPDVGPRGYEEFNQARQARLLRVAVLRREQHPVPLPRLRQRQAPARRRIRIGRRTRPSTTRASRTCRRRCPR